MKKIFILILCIVLSVSLFGCSKNKAETASTQKQPVKINLPTDNSVNGYRNNTAGETSSSLISENTVIITESEDSNISTNSTTNGYTYFGNKNSKKFHLSDCSAAKNTKSENKVYFSTRQKFISSGYVPCKSCNP